MIAISSERASKKVNSNSLFCLSYISTFYKFRQKTAYQNGKPVYES